MLNEKNENKSKHYLAVEKFIEEVKNLLGLEPKGDVFKDIYYKQRTHSDSLVDFLSSIFKEINFNVLTIDKLPVGDKNLLNFQLNKAKDYNFEAKLEYNIVTGFILKLRGFSRLGMKSIEEVNLTLARHYDNKNYNLYELQLTFMEIGGKINMQEMLLELESKIRREIEDDSYSKPLNDWAKTKMEELFDRVANDINQEVGMV